MHEGAHDENVHLRGPLALEHRGQHGYALLCEGAWQGEAEVAPLLLWRGEK
jgi:hypothetical protein